MTMFPDSQLSALVCHKIFIEALFIVGGSFTQTKTPKHLPVYLALSLPAITDPQAPTGRTY